MHEILRVRARSAEYVLCCEGLIYRLYEETAAGRRELAYSSDYDLLNRIAHALGKEVRSETFRHV